ncbi:MAG TPA: hypothetical protein VGK96_00955, partial [Candidatus Sulfotelmatobacter sp.]
RRQALGNNRPLLFGAPTTPSFRPGDDFNPRHRTVSSTRANTIACISAYQPDTPSLRKAAITGRLLLKRSFTIMTRSRRMAVGTNIPITTISLRAGNRRKENSIARFRMGRY